jgi:hypothetical protein
MKAYNSEFLHMSDDLVDPDEDPNPGGNCQAGIPCPPFEEVRLTISATAPFGHLLVDGYTEDQHVRPVSTCPVCQTVKIDQ